MDTTLSIKRTGRLEFSVYSGPVRIARVSRTPLAILAGDLEGRCSLEDIAGWCDDILSREEPEPVRGKLLRGGGVL